MAGSRVNGCALRFGPALLMLAAALAALGVAERAGAGGLDRSDLPVPPPSPLVPPCEEVEALIGISQQAAMQTGSLALAGREERPARARAVAAQVRALAGQAAARQAGAELAGVLEELAGTLAGYARGEGPSALGGVRAASARNARVRKALSEWLSNCGGGQ